jgi:hypothetical protein
LVDSECAGATLGRCEGQDTVLCVHDTTVFRFKAPREGLGEYAGRTLFGHVSMTVGSDGVPLGVVGLHPWARGKDTVTQRKHRGELTYHRSVGLPNEQDRWISPVDQVESILDRARVLHVMDSEADKPTRMREFVSSCPAVCTRSVPLSKRQKTRFRANTKQKLPRQSRQATLSIGAGVVALRAPPYCGKDIPQSLPLHVVWVREVDVADEVEPVEWTLMTTDPIDTPEQILAVVDGYRHRWKIEELFKALLDLAQGFLIAKKCDQS